MASNYTKSGIPQLAFQVPQSDYRLVTINVTDCDGDAADISTWAEITYEAWNSEESAANGDTAIVAYSLSGGEINILGTSDGFWFEFEGADSALLTSNQSFHQCRATDSAGDTVTLFAGLLRTPRVY